MGPSSKSKLIVAAGVAAILGEAALVFFVRSLPMLVMANLAALLIAEIVFQLVFRFTKGAFYRRVEKVDPKDIFVTSHPFLTFANKRNFRSIKPNMKVRYPLHESAHFSFPPVRTNNFGHLDGPTCDRPVIMPKPKDQIRVLCLGASTTGNYISQNGETYSYPLELERYLQHRFPNQEIVVHNCGQGGWTSAEILINYALNLRGAEPDVVAIYHAYNDLPVSLTANFVPDYSHARRNLAADYYKYHLASFIPMVPLGLYNFVVQTVFPFLHPSAGVLDSVSVGKIDLDGDFKGLKTYERNMESLLALCRADGAEIVLSTFAHCLYDQVAHSKVHLKYKEGLNQENDVIRKIAEKHGVSLVDNARLVPEDIQYFVDSIHFTPKGMRLIAENIGQQVAYHIAKRQRGGRDETICRTA